VPPRASGCGPVTRRSKVFSKVSNGESVRTRWGPWAAPFPFGAAIRPWGLPRFSPELTPLAGTPRLRRMRGSRRYDGPIRGVRARQRRGVLRAETRPDRRSFSARPCNGRGGGAQGHYPTSGVVGTPLVG
jgi:hypothetical protein